MDDQTGKPRRRDAERTRTAILASARQAFARAGYDGVGVREIAAAAGVTAMMVNRYFGSKENLFAVVVAQSMADPVILTEGNTSDPARMAEAFVDALLGITAPGASPLDGFAIMLQSGSSERAAQIAREQIGQHHHKTLTAALTGDLGPERAAVLLALVAGLQVMRQVIALPALANAAPADLKEILLPILQQLTSPPR